MSLHTSIVRTVPPPARAGGFDFAPPVRLFSTSGYVRSTNRGYDVAPDGRFLVVSSPAPLTATDRATITLIANWFEDVRARVK